MASSENSDEADKFSQETFYKSSSPKELEESLPSPAEIKPESKSDESDLSRSRDITSLHDDTKFLTPASLSLISSGSSGEKLHFTNSQDLFPGSESNETFDCSKVSNVSQPKDSPKFGVFLDPGNLTPSSVDINDSNNQDVFATLTPALSTSNQVSDRLSQANVATFSSSTPVLRDSSSEDSEPAAKRIKLDPDSSVEVVAQTENNSSSLILKSDSSEEEPEKVKTPEKQANKPDKKVEDSSKTDTIEIASSWVDTPLPATESDFTLHYTQTGSQVKELTEVDNADLNSNGGKTSENSLSDAAFPKNGSWGSHNYENASSFDSHQNLTAQVPFVSSKLKEKHNIYEKSFYDSSGPFQAVFKEIYDAQTNKFLHLELSEFSYTPTEERKVHRFFFSGSSSGNMADISSSTWGSSSCSVPGPFPLKGHTVVMTSSSENCVDHSLEPTKILRRGRRSVLNGSKASTPNLQPSPIFKTPSVPIKCACCKSPYPSPQFLSPFYNGVQNGSLKPGILSANSSVHPETPDTGSSSNSLQIIDNAVETNALNSDSNRPINLKMSIENPYSNGTIMLGLWSNIYYPCQVLSSIEEKFNVAFLDNGAEKIVTKNKLVPLNLLCPGTLLKVQPAREEDYVIGELQHISDSNSEAPFTIKVHNEIRNFPIGSIAISEQQRKVLIKLNKPPAVSNLSAIDLENCFTKKRIRTPRQSLITNLPTPKNSKSARKLFKGVDCKPSTSEIRSKKPGKIKATAEYKSSLSDSDFEFKHYKLDLSGHGIREVHLEKADDPLDDFLNTSENKLKQKNVTHQNDDKDIIEKFGPIPIKGSNLFLGFVFVLSCTDNLVIKSEIHLPTESEVTETEVESESDPKGKYPFSRSRLISQIRAGGGVYYSSITDVPFNELKNCILISNKPSLTCTYIYSIVEGIRAYTQDIIIRCCINNEPFSKVIETENYLPNGWSYSAGLYKYVPKKNHKETTRPKILEGHWILLLLDANENCIAFWTAILEIAGAQVKQGYAKVGTDSKPVFAITDESCPKQLLEKKDIKCVSVVWLIQSLINNVVLNHKHPHFKYDFTSSLPDDIP